MKKLVLALALSLAPAAAFAHAGAAPVRSSGEAVSTDQMNALTVRYACAKDAFAITPNAGAEGAVRVAYTNASNAKTAGNLSVFNLNVTAFSKVLSDLSIAC